MIIAVLCVKSKSYKYKRKSVLLFLAVYIKPVSLWFKYIKVEQVCSFINDWSNKVDLLPNDK